MRVQRFEWDGGDPASLARELRALQRAPEKLSEEVAGLIEEVGAGGDEAVRRLEQRFGEGAPEALRVPDEALAEAAESVELRRELRVAETNIRAVAAAEIRDDIETEHELPSGQMVRVRSVPVASAGAYVPGGNASYPSTALMCCLPAKQAGVERVVVASPPGPNGVPDELVLAACSMAGASEVYAMGGAQAIAALALGTESVQPVDLIVGPGNRYVQEAKRQLFGRVGVDGISGPSELMVIVDGSVDARWIALDLAAQAEHGSEGLLVAASAEVGDLDDLEREVDALVRRAGGSPEDAPLALVVVPSLELAVGLANALAPEHLELACADADGLADAVRFAGAVFTGQYGATAFGDFAAGSNHVLPTGGAGRFNGPLGPRSFRRRIATVRIPYDAARTLTPTVARLARAEGFPLHADSVEKRVTGSGEGNSR
jgi:histidinol dehydrogenase